MLSRLSPALIICSMLFFVSSGEAQATSWQDHLSTTRAEYAARGVAWHLPVPSSSGVDWVAVNWCARWSRLGADCNVNATGYDVTSTYDPCLSKNSDGGCVPGYDVTETPVVCSVSVQVHRSARTHRVWTRREPDFKCVKPEASQ